MRRRAQARLRRPFFATMATESFSLSGTPRSVTSTCSRSPGCARKKNRLDPIINMNSAAIDTCGRMA